VDSDLPPSIAGFLGWLAVEKGRSANTIAAYRRDLAGAAASFADDGKLLDQASTGDLERYLEQLGALGQAPSSVSRAASTLRGYFRFLVDEEIRRDDPTADLGARRSGTTLPKALRVDQISLLLDSVSGEDPLSLRDRAVLEFLYATGARVGELVGLNLVDLDRSDGLVLLRGKGGRERIVPVGRLADQAIGQWLSESGRGALRPVLWKRRGDESAVFLTDAGTRLTRQAVFALLRRRAAVVGLDAVLSPHVLRHSCATHLLAAGADVRVVQELLGHRSIATTQRYTKVDTAQLRSVIERAHPRGKSRHTAI